MGRVLLTAVLLTPLFLREAAGQDRKKSPPEPKVWMCLKGELLWAESFAGTALPKDWRKGQGNWEVAAGILSGAELPADKHPAYVTRKVSDPNVVIQVTFKLDGAGWLGCSFESVKEHVAGLRLTADLIQLSRITGIGPTTRGTEIDACKTRLDDGAWHTLVWEICGDEMVATVDDRDMTLAKVDGLSMERLQLVLNARGQWARFKDIKVWKAVQDKAWPQNKARLKLTLKK